VLTDDNKIYTYCSDCFSKIEMLKVDEIANPKIDEEDNRLKY